MTTERKRKTEALTDMVRGEYEDALIVRKFQSTRTLLRSKHLHPNMKPKLTHRLAELQTQAIERGIVLPGTGRPDPRRDGGLLFSYKLRIGIDGEGKLTFTTPVENERPRRRRKPDPKPTSREESPGELLDLLERSLEREMGKG